MKTEPQVPTKVEERVENFSPREARAKSLAQTMSGPAWWTALTPTIRALLIIALLLALGYLFQALVTGLLVFVPYLGFGMGLVLGMLAALTQFSGAGPIIAVAAVFGVGQLLEGFLLTPYPVGYRIGLHPLAVLFALMAFGQLFGFVGVLLALPASAALLVALRMARRSLMASEPSVAAPKHAA